ncbi:MAG: class I SAM-dependent rRNA methyltransferase [Burkholderiales bacterium]|nr:class I SAM-dependent rRNA methyltransferase [Anaerolineae bacterium]
MVTIKSGREKPIKNRHPWIFSGAIEAVKGGAAPGDIVTVMSHDDKFLARGYWNPKSQIQVRILTWQDEPIDEAWWRRMLKRAIDARHYYNDIQGRTTYNEGYRVVNADNDFIPGLIVDRYNEWLVLQALTFHVDQHKAMIARLLAELFAEMNIPVKGIYERSDVDVRGKEGLKQETGLLWGEEPPEYIQMGQEALIYLVDVRKGHKTGTYLDQKPNHALLEALFEREYGLSPETSLLNLFSYTGRFGLAAPGHVTNVDASRDVLELAEKNYQLSLFEADDAEFIQADVFEYLRDIAAEGQQFDVVILDPPKFAQNAQQVDKAARGYKDINLNAFRVVKPGGYLMTFSCSGAIDADLFQKIVFGALADSGREAQILRHLGPGDDHPVALTFPEGAYLKGLLLRVY